MQVDRQRFLVLVATLTTGFSVGGGCANPPPTNDPHGDPGSPKPGSTTDLVVAPIASVSPATEPKASPAGTEDGPTRVVPTASTAATKPPNPYDGTPVTAQACNPLLNREGKAPACTLKPPGPTCESFRDTQKECPTLNQLLKPRVAAAAIECLRRRSGTPEICEFNVSSICAYEALGSACLDPAATAACTSVMAKCKGPKSAYSKMTRESCEAGVSGIADAKRAKFISCISESCRFETCLTYL